MNFTSRDLVAQAQSLPNPYTTSPASVLRAEISQALSGLASVPTHWLRFYSHNVSSVDIDLIVGELVMEGWEVQVKNVRFSLLSLMGGHKTTLIKIRG